MMHNKAILLLVAMASIYLRACLPAAAAKLGDGAGTSVAWKVLPQTNFTFKLSVTGVPSLEWAGGALYFPTFTAVFNSRAQSPYWLSRGPTGDWDEVACRQASFPAGASFRLIGLFEGWAIYGTVLVADNSVKYRTRQMALFPPKIAQYGFSGYIGRKSKAQAVQYLATLSNGKQVSGNLNGTIAKLPDVIALEIREGNQCLKMNWNGADARLNTYYIPEKAPMENATIAELDFLWRDDLVMDVTVTALKTLDAIGNQP